MGKSKSKKKSTPSTSTSITTSKPVTTSTPSIFHNSPVYDVLHYFEKAPDQWTARYILVLSAIILRTAIGLGGYSGYQTPPMHGDFEAQRHWMELTIHLPIKDWYFYDLQYWGLDYPILTAYHSYICGIIGSFINPSWFGLDSSRGIEGEGIKTFMRMCVIVSELIIYIPGVLKIANLVGGKKFRLNRMDQIIIALIIVNQSNLLLIDHGHFQFNCIMLGFFVWSVVALIQNDLVMGSFWFVCCFNFKQMGLYYALFIFFYILSQIRSFGKLVMVGLTVILTQFVFLLPFIITQDWESIGQMVIRVFPFNRGLFEDKVANFWCVTNILVKYRTFSDVNQLSKLALVATLLTTIPVNIYIFYKIIKRNNHLTNIKVLIYGFSINALSFYLFSYQVHEKSILVPLIPINLLLLINPADNITMVQFINTVGTFSLYPLLKKDDLILQYFVSNLLMNWLIGYKLIINRKIGTLNFLVVVITYILIIAYHVIDATLSPPVIYPDLWVILNTAISFGAFGYFWLWLIYRVYIT